MNAYESLRIQLNHMDGQWSNSFSNLNLQMNQPPQVTVYPKKLFDLPDFDGSPESWPIFISQYIASIREYLYSNLQNVMRLTKALKGSAKEHVQSLLINPDNVDLVLKQLQFLYGRPEILLESQLREIRTIDAITENHIEMSHYQ